MSPINHNDANNNATNILLNEIQVKRYTKDYETSYFGKLKKFFINSRIIKKAPKGTIGFIAGASLGFIIIETICLVTFKVTSKKEKNLALSNLLFNDTMMSITVLYTVVCAIIGYFIEVDNYHKNYKYVI